MGGFGPTKAILGGNYRGGLSEYLRKDLIAFRGVLHRTKNHKLSFNTATIKSGRNSQFETCCMLVLGWSTYQTFGVADSKKKSVNQAAKKMLVTLGVIPPPNIIKEQNIPKQQASSGKRSREENVPERDSLKRPRVVNDMLPERKTLAQKTTKRQVRKKQSLTKAIKQRTHGLGAESQGGEDFKQGVGGGSPWTLFLEQQQKQNPVNETWTKGKRLMHRQETHLVMWEQMKIIMKRNKPMNVMMMKDRFPGPKEKRPRVTAIGIVLGWMLQKGLVRVVEKKGEKSKWLWTRVC